MLVLVLGRMECLGTLSAAPSQQNLVDLVLPYSVLPCGPVQLSVVSLVRLLWHCCLRRSLGLQFLVSLRSDVSMRRPVASEEISLGPVS